MAVTHSANDNIRNSRPILLRTLFSDLNGEDEHCNLEEEARCCSDSYCTKQRVLMLWIFTNPLVEQSLEKRHLNHISLSVKPMMRHPFILHKGYGKKSLSWFANLDISLICKLPFRSKKNLHIKRSQSSKANVCGIIRVLSQTLYQIQPPNE